MSPGQWGDAGPPPAITSHNFSVPEILERVRRKAHLCLFLHHPAEDRHGSANGPSRSWGPSPWKSLPLSQACVQPESEEGMSTCQVTVSLTWETGNQGSRIFQQCF